MSSSIGAAGGGDRGHPREGAPVHCGVVPSKRLIVLTALVVVAGGA